jgi:hypothetical protein
MHRLRFKDNLQAPLSEAQRRWASGLPDNLNKRNDDAGMVFEQRKFVDEDVASRVSLMP